MASPQAESRRQGVGYGEASAARAKAEAHEKKGATQGDAHAGNRVTYNPHAGALTLQCGKLQRGGKSGEGGEKRATTPRFRRHAASIHPLPLRLFEPLQFAPPTSPPGIQAVACPCLQPLQLRAPLRFVVGCSASYLLHVDSLLRPRLRRFALQGCPLLHGSISVLASSCSYLWSALYLWRSEAGSSGQRRHSGTSSSL